MEVHRQRCQKCGSLKVQNLLAREQGLPTAVYVRCVECGELVARYRLRSYYHHGKGLESYLRSQASNAMESGRESLVEFQNVQEESLESFQKVLDQLREEGKSLD